MAAIDVEKACHVLSVPEINATFKVSDIELLADASAIDPITRRVGLGHECGWFNKKSGLEAHGLSISIFSYSEQTWATIQLGNGPWKSVALGAEALQATPESTWAQIIIVHLGDWIIDVNGAASTEMDQAAFKQALFDLIKRFIDNLPSH